MINLLSLLSSPSSDVSRAVAGFTKTVDLLDRAMAKAELRTNAIDKIQHKLEGERMRHEAARQKAQNIKARVEALIGK